MPTEPDADEETELRYLEGFILHYIKSDAVSMLPRQAVDEFRGQRNIQEQMIRVDSKCSYWQRRR